ncbi:NAD(+) diphosphatase [Treponema sp. C6A8]|uniref:NAD(+) diphosphatase n=1 Tax=Treponema sp. C6A8 TaxID=1410609 RepID=UPI0004848ABB|nr:NAD(+) diphosphatase [Treponema sp. C6A8]
MDRCFVLCDSNIVLKADGTLPEFSELEKIKADNPLLEYFEEKNTGIKVLGLSSAEKLGSSYKVLAMREFFAENADDEIRFQMFRAKSLLNWRATAKFCSFCGQKLDEHPLLTARICPSCKNVFFPRIEPCIIVLVTKGEKILLARHTQRNQDIYACIAGFIEAGESAEHAVAREIFEETGLRVKNIQYRGSQSWPFPAQIMLGFTAEYESGDIVLQKEELSDAQWFDRNNCPASPKPGSIAYQLIHGEI